MNDVEHGKKPVKPWYNPPSLLARQAGSLFLAAALTGWTKAPAWLIRHGFSCIPGAAGSLGMGCIGFPMHPVIELTESCNLSCIHCHASDITNKGPELETGEVFRLLDELALVSGFRMVAFTGGEPLLRPDLLEILDYARKLGFSTTLASNGTLITPVVAHQLASAGLSIAAISLDATDAGTHDSIRGKKGSFERAYQGMKAVKDAGIVLHINITIAAYNEDQVSSLIRAADQLGAAILIIYQLIPVGRGEQIAPSALNKEGNKKMIRSIVEGQGRVSVVIEPVGGPQYWADLLHGAGITKGIPLSLAECLFHGCCAGRGFVYIKPQGDVLACPFIPVSCGNVREEPFDEIYRRSPLIRDLQDRDNLSGACGRCTYRNVCGGCRGRAYASGGDVFAEDPACYLRDEWQ